MISVTTNRVWLLEDPDDNKLKLQPGTHELERVPAPNGMEGNWLVLKGTKMGMHEGAWRGYGTFDGAMKIDLTENSTPLLPFPEE